MKRCTQCAEYWPDSNAFCGTCGGALVDAGFVENNDEKTVAATEYKEHINQMEENPVQADADFGAVVTDEPEKKAKSKKPLVAVLVTVLVVALVFGAGVLTNWFGLGSPLNGLVKAAMNTAQAKSFTVEISIDDASYDEVSTLKYQGNLKKEEISFVYEEDYCSECLYDGYYYTVYDDGDAYKSEAELDEFFESVNKFYDGKKVDWEEVITDADLEDYVKHEEVEGFLKDVYRKCLSDKKWLKEYLGFEKSGNTYTFEPDLEKLFEEVNSICQDADVFTRKAKNEIEDEIDEMIEDVEDEEIEMFVEIKLKAGKISTVDINVYDDGDERTMNVEFSDINKTNVEKDAQDIIDEYEDYAKDHSCDECDQVLYEYNYHGDCDECGTHGDLWDEDLCEDCYKNEYYNYCDECGDYEETYYYDGDELCWDCYDEVYYDDFDYCSDCGDYAKMYKWDGEYYCYDCYLVA